MKTITRRQFGVSAAAMATTAVAGVNLPRLAFAEPEAGARSFPQDFRWGCATAAYQIEGGAADDVINAEGRIEDTDRVMYLRNHLTHLHRAAAEGYPVKGYFLWSLMDNFEWADGYSKRFGIHYVDFKTLKRTPKQSAEWYREVIARNEVMYGSRRGHASEGREPQMQLRLSS